MERSPANGGGNLALSRLRYEHTVRALDRHAAVLGDLRSRASILLSATGITASLFGTRALDSGAPGWINWLALAFVGLGLAACLAVLSPVHDAGPVPDDPRRPRSRIGRRRARRWKVTLSGDELDELTGGRSEEGALDAIVDALAPARRLNYRTLEERTLAFNAAALFLVLQVCTWSAALLAG